MEPNPYQCKDARADLRVFFSKEGSEAEQHQAIERATDHIVQHDEEGGRAFIGCELCYAFMTRCKKQPVSG